MDTVMLQDNAPVHRSKERQSKLPTRSYRPQNANVFDILSGGGLFIEQPIEYSSLVLPQNDELLYAFQPTRQSAITKMVFVYCT
ncbi:hypothetical protein SprV_0401408800 [Sparganum proliferum]